MKTIEEKAKAYDEALERARNLHKDAIDTEENLLAKQCEVIFPELKSEDEKIRKWLLDFVQGLPDEGLDFHFYNLNKEQVIAWLEKQGKKKQLWSKEDEIGFNDTLWVIQQARTIVKDENDMGNLWYAEDWLKSLKYRYMWKPTKEHVEAVRLARSFVTDDFSENPTLSEILIDLEEQLKKLMDE